MPFRYASLRAVLAACELAPSVRAKPTEQFRKFHGSRPLRDDGSSQDTQNHYEALNISTQATPAEIKKYAPKTYLECLPPP
jgi:hypothetical protein